MIAAKRFSRYGLAASALAHIGILAVVLVLARGASQEAAVPPDAMQVQIITQEEAPRYSGTPSMLRTSGTEHAAQSQAPTATSEQPPTPPSPPRPKDQHQAQRNAPPKPEQPSQAKELETKAPPLPQAETAQVAMAQPPPDPPAPSTEKTPDAPDTAATAAYLALAGGKLGGGFAAPPIDSPLVGYDFTVPFRELVSTCGASPPGISPDEKISIVVRVFLNPDGTVTAAPQLLESNPSAKQLALMEHFAAGLQKCQPYTMLPQNRYSQWKTLDLVVYSHSRVAQ
jgi:hypothetical protein